jgi:predicted GNAT family N-acyltransferase
MSYQIQIAKTRKEKEAVYQFRYQVYVEEMGKQHIEADHQQHLVFDEMDDYGTIYYACSDNNVIGTVRSLRGTEESFAKVDNRFFEVRRFQKYIKHEEMGVVDRLMVDKAHRLSRLGHDLLATYLEGVSMGTNLCFVCCEDFLLPIYLRYGLRVYEEPAQLATGGKRHKLVLFLRDREHLTKVNSPFLPHLPGNIDDQGFYVNMLEEKAGISFSSGLYSTA